MTRFPDVARTFAISRAASRRRSSRKPLFARIASPISSALRASPCARTIIDYWESVSTELRSRLLQLACFSCMAWSTKNAALRAVCCATLVKQTVIRHSPGKLNLSEDTDLFCFDGMCKFRGECDMSDGHVVQHNVESQSSICEILADQSRDLTRHG